MPNNTTVNKVIVNGITKIDLTGDTATPADVAQGKTFHDASGALQTGTASGGGGESWSWMGKNPTKVSTLVNEKVFLKDTAFATWTPSNTAQSIRAPVTCAQQAIDLLSYDYFIVGELSGHFDYADGASGKVRIIDEYYSYWQNVYAYHNSLSDMENDTTSKATNTTISTIAQCMFYKTSKNVDTFAHSGGYGIYTNTSSITTPTVTVSTIKPTIPNIYVKCGNNYFPTTSCALVNQDTSYYKLKVELWRVDHQTTPYGAINKNLHDLWLNS